MSHSKSIVVRSLGFHVQQPDGATASVDTTVATRYGDVFKGCIDV
jgi:hypothetical protein